MYDCVTCHHPCMPCSYGFWHGTVLLTGSQPQRIILENPNNIQQLSSEAKWIFVFVIVCCCPSLMFEKKMEKMRFG